MATRKPTQSRRPTKTSTRKPAARSAPKAAAKTRAKAKAVPRKSTTAGRRSSDAPRSAFDFDDRLALRTLRTADPILGRSIDAIGAFALAREVRATKSVYEALAEAIVAQQLSGKAAATIYGRVCALFPGNRGGPRPEQILATSDEALRGAGLSRAKGLALRDLAERTLAGEIPTLAQARRLDDDEVVARLTAVRGIGRWTAEMFLIFRLGRPDVLPVDDYGVRKGFALAFGHAELPHPKALSAHGERWAPFRTVASWYLWRVADRG
jgi:3-methyladenine DNA glycosylase/8-oxoguanine DNA glycosylase